MKRTENNLLEIDMSEYSIHFIKEEQSGYSKIEILDAYGSVLGNLDPSDAKKEEKFNSTVFYTEEEAFSITVIRDAEKESISFEYDYNISDKDIIDALVEYIDSNYDAITELGYEALLTEDVANSRANEYNKKYGTKEEETVMKTMDKNTQILEKYKNSTRDEMSKALNAIEQDEKKALENRIFTQKDNVFFIDMKKEKEFLSDAIKKESPIFMEDSGFIMEQIDTPRGKALLVDLPNNMTSKKFMEKINETRERDTMASFLYQDEKGLSQIVGIAPAENNIEDKTSIVFVFEEEQISNTFAIAKILDIAKKGKEQNNIHNVFFENMDIAYGIKKKEEGIVSMKKEEYLKNAPQGIKEIAKQFLSQAEGFFSDIELDVAKIRAEENTSDYIVGVRPSGTTLVLLDTRATGEVQKNQKEMVKELTVDFKKEMLLEANNKKFFFVNGDFPDNAIEISVSGVNNILDRFQKHLDNVTEKAIKDPKVFSIANELYNDKTNGGYKNEDEYLTSPKIDEITKGKISLSVGDKIRVLEARTVDSIGAVISGAIMSYEGEKNANNPRRYNGVEINQIKSQEGEYSQIRNMTKADKNIFVNLLENEAIPEKVKKELLENEAKGTTKTRNKGIKL